jgi:hypothetical protein
LDYYATYAESVYAVTAEQALAAATKYFVPDRFVVVAIGDRSKIEADLKKLNLPIEIRDATDGWSSNAGARGADVDRGRGCGDTRARRETFPHECCGAMLGRDGVVREAFALPNTTEEGPRRRFLVRPMTIASPRSGRAKPDSIYLGSTIRTRITRRSRRNTISITPGRRSPT